MKKNGKGTLLQRMMALLLSAVLTAGTAFGTAPLNVLAQENLGGYNQTQESVSENTVEVTEEPQAESDEEKIGAEDAEESDVEPERNPAEPGEVVEEPDTPGETERQPETVAQTALLAEGAAPQTDAIASGDDWVLDADGKLTIRTDAGMADWCSLRDSKTPFMHPNQDSVKTVEIQTDVTGIADWAFYLCENLTAIEIPDSVASIGSRAFSTCSSLGEIAIPAGVTEIGEGAFLKCSSLTEIIIPSGVTSIGVIVFRECSSLREITIPSGVTSIGANAFLDCSSLRVITIPSGVISIEQSAFRGCSSLKEITIPSGVTNIEYCLFYGCSNLETVTMLSRNPVSLNFGEFAGCKFVTDNTKGIKVPVGTAETYKAAWKDWADYITDGTEDLYASGTGWALDNNGKLTIESDAGMENWMSLRSNGHPYSGSVKTAEIQDGVTSIGNNAFGFFKSLEEITIPNSVTDIGDYAFDFCSSLKSITIPDNVTSIGDSAFYGCSALTGITIPDSVTSIGEEAFRSCSGLISISLSNRLTSIGECAFHGCSSLTSITLPDSVTSIEDDLFWECSALTSITLPDSLASIGECAFYKCSSLTGITIPDSVTSIGVQAFGDCSGLTSIVLPPRVTSIEPGLFALCSTLEGITIPDGVTSIGESAFEGCIALESIKIPTSVTDIEVMAFAECSSLTSVTLPNNITKIGYGLFFECSKLESVIMQGSTPPTLESISGETYVFAECKFVTDEAQGIKVPAGTVEIYKEAWTEWADYITEYNAAADDKENVEIVKKAVEDALADIHVSNDTTKESLEAEIKDAVKKALEEAGISDDVAISVENFTKAEATTDAPGSIAAGIKITSGAESAEVTVDQTIDRLPGTPADKVAAVRTALEEEVKKAIDQALAGTKVTNDNAQEIAGQISALIPGAVTGALEAAGVGADEVEIGEVGIGIEPATADSEGSIRVTIPVTSREDAGQAGSASVQVPITKPGGEEDPDKEVEEAQKAVEEALRNITVTNETTEKDIQEELQEALGDKAKVEGIEKFEKEDATGERPGQISLSIRITVNGKTVVINATVVIPQLGKKTGVYVRFTDYYDMDGSTPLYKYTGLAIKPAVEVYNNEELLTPGTDYTVSYRNNTKPGAAAALTVKGKGNFSGTSNVVNFTIINADIGKDTDHPTEMTVVANTKVAPLIMNGTKKLTTKDYQLEGEGLVNGKYAAVTEEGNPNILTVKGTGSYVGSSFTVNVRVIDKKDARKLAVAVDKDFKPVYDGSAYTLSALFRQTTDGEGAITVTDSKDKTKILKEGTDFVTVCTSSLTNAGTVKFTVTGMGEYTGSVSKSFKISPLKVTDSERFSVTFDENKEYEYRASGVAVDNLVVKYLGETDTAGDGRILTQGVDYKVTYSNHKKVSAQKDAGLKITFLGNYKGSSAVSRTFKVVTAKLSERNTAVTVPDKVYTKGNRAYNSTPIVTVDGVTIKASSYTVSYAWATESEAGDDTKYLADNKVKITIADGDTWARARVTVTPKETGSYALAEGAVLTGEYYVRKADNAADLSKAKVTFFDKAGTQYKSLEYNGYPFYTPAGNDPDAENAPEDPNAVYVRVTVSGAVVDPSLYDVVWTNAILKGKATVVIRGKGTATEKGMAVGSKNQAISIKAMALKGKTLKSFMENAVNAANSFKDMFF